METDAMKIARLRAENYRLREQVASLQEIIRANFVASVVVYQDSMGSTRTAQLTAHANDAFAAAGNGFSE